MIGELSGLPNGVIGFEATGELKAKDCRDVILLVAVCPAIGDGWPAGFRCRCPWARPAEGRLGSDLPLTRA